MPGSTTVDGTRYPDPGGDSPLAQGEAKLGLNLGTVPARTSVTVTFDIEASTAVESASALGLAATFSSREIDTPAPANAAEPLSLAQLSEQIGRVPGVARADQLALVDLPPGSLRAGARRSARSGPGVRLRRGLPGARSVDPDRRRVLHARARTAERRSGPGPRCPPGWRRPGPTARTRRVAGRADQRHHRPDPGQVAVLQPPGATARTVRVRGRTAWSSGRRSSPPRSCPRTRMRPRAVGGRSAASRSSRSTSGSSGRDWMPIPGPRWPRPRRSPPGSPPSRPVRTS